MRFRAAMHPVPNYVEFVTNHEPHMVMAWCILYGAVHHVRYAAATNPTWFAIDGALNYVEFRAAMHPAWCMARHP